MQPILLPNGRVQTQDPSGFIHDIGPDHQDYQRLIAQSLGTRPSTNSVNRTRLFAVCGILVGLAAWWFNWHLAQTEGHFYIKLTLLGPLGFFGGLLMLIRPEWSGPLRKDSSTGHKASLVAVIVLMLGVSGLDFMRLKGYWAPQRQAHVPSGVLAAPREGWVPKFVSNSSDPATLQFLGRPYRLGAFQHKANPAWEFTAPGETVNQWTSLVTLIERIDAHSRLDLDKLSEGIMANYKSHGAQIVLAKTMQQGAYNYMVVAFEEPAQKRYEFNFVKVTVDPRAGGAVLIYSVRVGDPANYQATAKAFLTRESNGIGQALAAAAVPDMTSLPRREF